VGLMYSRKGKQSILRSLSGYSRAAQHSPWLILLDLDQDAECAPIARRLWLPELTQHLCLRIAVKEVEAWLLADRKGLSSFLRVPAAYIPLEPDAVSHPKELIVQLAKSSRNRDVRADIVPREGSGRIVGVGYTGRLGEFTGAYWRPEVAAQESDSLRRCVERVRELVSQAASL